MLCIYFFFFWCLPSFYIALFFLGKIKRERNLAFSRILDHGQSMCFATLFQWCLVEVYFWVFMFQVIFRVDGTFLHLLLLKWIWYLMRDASIASFSPFMVGILWSDAGDPEAGATVYNHDFFSCSLFLLWR